MPVLPSAFAASQTRRHPGLSLFSRHSNETAGCQEEQGSRAQVEPNIVAYQVGNAANVAPAATTSQTSFRPRRADRLEHRALRLVPRQEREQHADAEVETLEQK
jgi:hypothetical protein